MPARNFAGCHTEETLQGDANLGIKYSTDSKFQELLPCSECRLFGLITKLFACIYMEFSLLANCGFCSVQFLLYAVSIVYGVKKLGGLSPQANYTERPPLVSEVSAKYAGRGCHVVSVTDPYGRSLYFVFQIAPQLYSQG
jgi:hypothetical protein